jgi:hypothetical protein
MAGRRRRARRHGEASPATLEQIRTAAYRRWKQGGTPEAIAGVLEVRTVWVQEAIAPDFKRVVELYSVGANAGEIAAELELPEGFVTYAFRRINAAAAAARARRTGARA